MGWCLFFMLHNRAYLAFFSSSSSSVLGQLAFIAMENRELAGPAYWTVPCETS